MQSMMLHYIWWYDVKSTPPAAIFRALTVLARVSSNVPQTPGTVGGPCAQLTQAAGLAFTFSRKVHAPQHLCAACAPCMCG